MEKSYLQISHRTSLPSPSYANQLTVHVLCVLLSLVTAPATPHAQGASLKELLHLIHSWFEVYCQVHPNYEDRSFLLAVLGTPDERPLLFPSSSRVFLLAFNSFFCLSMFCFSSWPNNQNREKMNSIKTFSFSFVFDTRSCYVQS